jgi:hypothetical protein
MQWVVRRGSARRREPPSTRSCVAERHAHTDGKRTMRHRADQQTRTPLSRIHLIPVLAAMLRADQCADDEASSDEHRSGKNESEAVAVEERTSSSNRKCASEPDGRSKCSISENRARPEVVSTHLDLADRRERNRSSRRTESRTVDEGIGSQCAKGALVNLLLIRALDSDV